MRAADLTIEAGAGLKRADNGQLMGFAPYFHSPFGFHSIPVSLRARRSGPLDPLFPKPIYSIRG